MFILREFSRGHLEERNKQLRWKRGKSIYTICILISFISHLCVCVCGECVGNEWSNVISMCLHEERVSIYTKANGPTLFWLHPRPPPKPHPPNYHIPLKFGRFHQSLWPKTSHFWQKERDILFILNPSSIQTWENVQNISIKHTRNDIDECEDSKRMNIFY
jgi:hypothetical protein